MKFRSSFLAIAGVSALFLGGCAEETLLRQSEGNTVITAEIADNDGLTRTCVDPATYDNDEFVGIMWTPSDSIGVFNDNTRNALFLNTSQTNARKTDFSGNIDGDPLYAYYPYRAENAGKDARSLTGRVSDVQKFSLSTGEISDDYKIGRPEADSKSRFNFTHLFSLIKVDLDASDMEAEGQTLEYVKMEVSDPQGNPRAVAGNFTFDATAYENPTYSNVTNSSSSIRMEWTDRPTLDNGRRLVGFISAIPDIRQGDKLILTVATTDNLYIFDVTSKVTFESGYIYNFPMKLSALKEKYDMVKSERAKFSDFGFTVSANQGKILDKRVECSSSSNSTSYNINSVTSEQAQISGSEVSITIPYLYDFKLVPTFTASKGAKVYVNGNLVESGKTEIDFSKGPVEFSVETAEDTHIYKVSVQNSGLPVVVVNQSKSGDFSEVKEGGFLGMGSKVRNKFLDFMIRGKETSWVENDKITVYNPDGSVDLAQAACGMRQRGNSTKKYPKKAMAIKLVKKSAVLGMPSSKRWVLLANWLDHSVIRNAAGFALANLIRQGVAAEGLEPGIPWNPSGRNVELIIDGRHVGNYLLAEQIKIEKNRLNIADTYEDLVADGKAHAYEDCGFLFEFDQSYDEIWKFKTAKSTLPVQVKDDEVGSDNNVWSKIQAKINGIDTNLVAGNYSAAYADYDIYSAIDQWFVYELTQNREYTEPRSVYYFINKGDKLTAGPVWDFDRGTFHNPTRAKSMGNETNRIKPYDQWLSEFSTGNTGTTPGVWYRSLIKDPEFRTAVKARWQKLLPYLEMLPAEIERLGAVNARSWEYNNRMWPTTSAVRKHGNDNNTFKDWSGDEDLATYEEVIENMINCYLARLAGMDALINAL